MRLLVTGVNGQVGFELARALQPLGEVHAWDRRQADLSQPEALAERVRALRPDAIVNAAAYTAVDRAEQEEALATRINGEAPGALAEVARDLGALLVHYSTDYVFDGSGDRPWREDDATAPLNAYGRGKLEGERRIAAAGGDWLVLRASWVYAARGGNFPKTMLRLAAERERLNVVADQFGAPTSARLIADCTAHIVRQAQAERAGARFAPGVFNLVASGACSWHELAVATIEGARARGRALKVGEIAPIPASAYPLPTLRPANSRLSLERLGARFGIVPPDWRVGLGLVLDELVGGG
jgi:dTDP-4-dehydrorhamnose reductase